MLKKAFGTPRFFGFRRNHNNSLTTSSVSSDQRGIRFCIWVALKFENLSYEPYCLVNRILFNKNWYSIYWEALELLKKNGVLVTSDSVRALVRSYSHMGYTEKAIESFSRMREFGVEPDAHMYNTILRDVLNEKLLELALALYTTMLKSNVDPNFYTYNMLIDGFCKRGEVKGAQEMLDEMKRVGIVPCVLSTTSILYGCCQANNVDEAHKLFNDMKETSYPPDMISCNVVLNGFCKMGRLEEALSFVWMIKNDGFSLNRNSYSSLINAFFKARRYREAHAWYTKMFKEGIVPDVVLYAIMIRGLSKEGRVGEAAKMLEEMTQIGLTPDAYCYNAVIQGLCDVGLLNRAQSLRLEISEHNVCTHTILICEMCKRGMVAEAQELFNQMEKLGCEPSVVTFNTLINGLCKAKNLEKAKNLFCKLEVGRRHSLHLSLSQGSGQFSDSARLLKKAKEMCEAGQILRAYKLITDLAGEVKPDIITYNILLNALCMDREVNAAYNFFEFLQKKGYPSPDNVTYGTIIKGLFMVDREDEAFKVFQRMQKTGSEPTLSVYRTLMTCLCRKSKVSRAFTLYLEHLKSLPSRDNDSISTLEKYLFGEKLEQVIRGLLELDFKARDFKLAPYTILLIGFCQAGKVSEALIILSVLDEFNIKINATSCVHLIRGLCKEQRLHDAVKIFLYSLEKGFMLKPMICNHLLTCLLYSRDYKECAVDLIGRMESFGYRLNSEEFATTLALLQHYQKGKKRKITIRKD